MVTSLIVNYWGINKSLFATCILAIYFVVKSWGALDSRKIFHEARLSYCLQSCFRDLLSDEWKNTFCTQASHFDIFWSHDCANNVLTSDKWYFFRLLGCHYDLLSRWHVNLLKDSRGVWCPFLQGQPHEYGFYMKREV